MFWKEQKELFDKKKNMNQYYKSLILPPLKLLAGGLKHKYRD